MIELQETIMVEAGPLSGEEITAALAGKLRTPEAKAFVSLIESFITNQRQILESRGMKPQDRDEAAGAVDVLKTLRADVLHRLKSGMNESKPEK
jgi:hypothetical protein